MDGSWRCWNWGTSLSRSLGGGAKLGRSLFLHRNFAAPLAFAAVLSGAPIVAGLAATLALAAILALAGVLLGSRAPAVALATVLSGAPVVAGLAATLSLARVHALAGVLLRGRVGRRARGAAAQKRAHAETACRRSNQLSKLPPVHSRVVHRSLHSESLLKAPPRSSSRAALGAQQVVVGGYSRFRENRDVDRQNPGSEF